MIDDYDLTLHTLTVAENDIVKLIFIDCDWNNWL